MGRLEPRYFSLLSVVTRGKMRQAAEAAVRLMRTEQHVSAPRRGELAVLTACADAMRDLPLRKMPEEVILATQRRGIR